MRIVAFFFFSNRIDSTSLLSIRNTNRSISFFLRILLFFLTLYIPYLLHRFLFYFILSYTTLSFSYIIRIYYTSIKCNINSIRLQRNNEL